jgi:hypothetical protein
MWGEAFHIKSILDSIQKKNLNSNEINKYLTIKSLAREAISSELVLSRSAKLSYVSIRFSDSYLTQQIKLLINAEKPKPVENKETGYIEYIFPSSELSMTIKIKESDKKIFERYVFPLPEDSLQFLLESDASLSREQANLIRDEYIEKIQDPEKKKEAYFMLQEKVTLVDPPNFNNIPTRNSDSVLLECFDAVNVVMERHYEELGMSYSVQQEPWTLATQDDLNIYIHKDCYDKALVQLDEALGQGMPVMVGVDWKAGGGNYDKITDHWVVITARRHDAKGIYYTYMEVAHRQTEKKDKKTGEWVEIEEDFERGTSTDMNRLYFDPAGYLVGIKPTVNSNGDLPIVTIIRLATSDSCCNRTNYLKTNEELVPENANRSSKEKAKGNIINVRLKTNYKR